MESEENRLEQILGSLLKKCQNITNVNLKSNVMNECDVLSLIGRYCHRIKSLKYNLYNNNEVEDEESLVIL